MCTGQRLLFSFLIFRGVWSGEFGVWSLERKGKREKGKVFSVQCSVKSGLFLFSIVYFLFSVVSFLFSIFYFLFSVLCYQLSVVFCLLSIFCCLLSIFYCLFSIVCCVCLVNKFLMGSTTNRW